MNILIICQWFPPEVAPIGVMLMELAEDLAKNGNSVTVITGFPNHPSGQVFKGYRKSLSTSEIVNGIRVVRCYLYTSPKKTFFRRVVNYLTFAVSSFGAAMMLRRQDLLFMVSPPLTNGLMALFLRHIKGIRYIFNVQDIFPDVAISTGVIRNGFLIRFLKSLELLIYHGAERIAVISEGFRGNLLAKGVSDAKIRVIDNWIDTGEIVPMPRDNEFARAHGLPGKFVVLYSGTIGMISGAKILIECAEKLKDRKDILFLFVGEGVVKTEIEEKARATGLDSIRFLPFQPRNILSQVQSSADVSVVTLLHRKGNSSVPSKILGYMAAARPVIASVDPDSDTSRLIERAGCGICVNAEDAPALTEAIETLYNDREKAALLGRQGREFLVAQCNRKVITSKYESLFSECCERRPK
ncbi:MAG: glycosyltransferase family 4 protein [Desulfuromonadales bacterium]|nr:glycosyltransferase family 4 protein [Desulfuromonadales bacterium]